MALQVAQESVGEFHAKLKALRAELARAESPGQKRWLELQIQANEKLLKLAQERLEEQRGLNKAAGEAAAGITDVGQSELQRQSDATKKALEERRRAREEAERLAIEQSMAEIDALGREVQWKKSLRDEEWRAEEEQNRRLRGLLEEHTRDAEKAIREREQLEEESRRNLARIVDQAARDAREKEEQYVQAGAILGNAFANALATAIEQGMAGEEVNIEEAILGALLGVLGPLGLTFGGPLGGAIAGAAGTIGMGILRGAQRSRRRFHDGGWAGLPDWAIPRFHDGGEVPAYLLPGERVLSHEEIRRMGGPAAVDAAARGGATTVRMEVYALDSQSFASYMADQGGRGFYHAHRAGRGFLGPLLRRAGVR